MELVGYEVYEARSPSSFSSWVVHVNTDQLLSWCDFVVDKIKLLKGQIKKVETAQKKYENTLEINLKKGVGND